MGKPKANSNVSIPKNRTGVVTEVGETRSHVLIEDPEDPKKSITVIVPNNKIK